MTQEQLAEKSGVDQTNISAIEVGKNRKPSWDTVARLSRALDIDPFELFPIESQPQVHDLKNEAEAVR